MFKHESTAFEKIDQANARIKKEFSNIKENVSQLWEWVDEGCSYNFIAPNCVCPNDCKYCYVKAIKKRVGIVELEQPTEEKLIFASNEAKVNKKWKPAKVGKVYMIPSSHDIFPENVDNYCMVAKNCISAHNSVLCVSKPRLGCIMKICDKMKPYKDNFRFRFTIGSANNDILKYWEPNAPTYEERISCVYYANEKGFNVSLSMEPLLDDPTPIIKKLENIVSSFWIGPMNHCAVLKFNKDEVDKLNSQVAKYYKLLKDHPKVHLIINRHNVPGLYEF